MAGFVLSLRLGRSVGRRGFVPDAIPVSGQWTHWSVCDGNS